MSDITIHHVQERTNEHSHNNITINRNAHWYVLAHGEW